MPSTDAAATRASTSGSALVTDELVGGRDQLRHLAHAGQGDDGVTDGLALPGHDRRGADERVS